MSDPVNPETPPSNPPPPVPPAAPPTPTHAPTGVTTEEEAKSLSMLAHVLNFTFWGPLIIFLVKKGQSAYLDTEAKEALNFSITCIPAYFVLALVGCIPFVGHIFHLGIPAIFIVQIVLGVMGGQQAKDGKPYRYPVNLRLIK